MFIFSSNQTSQKNANDESICCIKLLFNQQSNQYFDDTPSVSFEFNSYLRQRHFGRYSDENYELVNKVYDCLRHDVMVTKLDAYSLTKESLRIISDSLSYRKQRTNIVCGTPRGSILGPLLFLIFINVIFLVVEKSDICNTL